MRQSQLYTIRDPETFNREEHEKEAIAILENIKISKESELAARAWVELGVIYWSQHKLSGCLSYYKHSEKCFETAMGLRPDAYFVLQRYGQHLRYFRRLEHSKDILQKSIQINDTVCARHHLALTLQKIALESRKTGNTSCISLTKERISETRQPSCAFRSGNRNEREESDYWPRGQSVPRAHGNQMFQTKGEHLYSTRDGDNQGRPPPLSTCAQNVVQHARCLLQRPCCREVKHSNQKSTKTGIKSPKKFLIYQATNFYRKQFHI
jgi:hypothetical protein